MVAIILTEIKLRFIPEFFLSLQSLQTTVGVTVCKVLGITRKITAYVHLLFVDELSLI